MPVFGAPKASTLPRCTASAVYMGAGWPSSVGRKSPPVMATNVFVVKRNVGPARQNSSTGASGGLSTSRFAMCSARLSITPEGLNPLPR